jgi:uncharacterized protein (DUF58 family)
MAQSRESGESPVLQGPRRDGSEPDALLRDGAVLVDADKSPRPRAESAPAFSEADRIQRHRDGSQASLSDAERSPRARAIAFGVGERRGAELRVATRLPPPLLSDKEKRLTGWERFKRFMRPPRKLKVTREGKYYLGITLGVGFAAINTGNNLLYLLLGMLLSLMLVSGVMSDLSLRHLTVTRRLPVRAQVGRAHLVEIEVYNHKKRVPSYAIEVEDLRAGQPADKRCFFLKISPSSAQVAAYRRTPARRGRDRHTGFRIATRFPFGLFEKSREVEADGELIIYPAVDPVRLPLEEIGRRDGGIGANGRGGGDETYALRPMRDGDDPRDIYWRKSTIRDQIILRERARETRPDIELVIDSVRPAVISAAGPQAEAFALQFEKRIREVASRAVAHIKRGDGVVVSTTLGERVRGDKNLGSDPILRFLALLEAADEAKVPEIRAERALRQLRPDGGAMLNGKAARSGDADRDGRPRPSARRA